MNTLIEKATQFAAIKHEGQTRKGTNIPYIAHPFGVALILQQEKQSEHLIAAGLLHDTLEDTDTTEQELLDVFGEDVLSLVQAASEPDKSLPWEQRKEHTIQELPNRSNEEIALIVADKLHNLRSIKNDVDEKGELVWARFNRGKREQSWYYMGIVRALKEKKAEVPLVRKLEKEVYTLFTGAEKLTHSEIGLLFRCVYFIGEKEMEELREKGIEGFVEEIKADADAIYREGDYEAIRHLWDFLHLKGVEFEWNSEGPFILLAYLRELKHRLAWSDETFYKHFSHYHSKL